MKGKSFDFGFRFIPGGENIKELSVLEASRFMNRKDRERERKIKSKKQSDKETDRERLTDRETDRQRQRQTERQQMKRKLFETSRYEKED